MNCSAMAKRSTFLLGYADVTQKWPHDLDSLAPVTDIPLSRFDWLELVELCKHIVAN